MSSTPLYVFFLVLFIYCALSVTYIFILSFWGKFFYRSRTNPYNTRPEKKIAILVPAFKEDTVIVSTAKNLLKLDYPASLYDIYIIADSFKPETLDQLRRLPVQVMEVDFDTSTKTKSLNDAFSRIRPGYDIALICDADNVLAFNFLKKINHCFVNGDRAVQGRRVAKNLDSSYAVLDACSEAINNHIFRKGTSAMGLSSALIGSGMAFDFSLIRQVLSEIDAIGGFDKPLQLKVVQQGVTIRYLDDALIFDEKVSSSTAFRQQRERWMSSQFIYLREYFLPAVKQLFKGNLSYFNLAIINNMVMPRAFLLVILPVMIIMAAFIDITWVLAVVGLCMAYIVSLGMSIPTVMVNRDLLQAGLKLPKAVGLMFVTLFNIKKANKTFIHTVHTKTEVSNTLFNDHGR
jgi:cellulose synthase/poly-beta-1,6-N-acetylglucosamine synthase-like glycosyltransferase